MVEGGQWDRLSENDGGRPADDGGRRVSVFACGVHGFLSVVFDRTTGTGGGNYRASGVREPLRGLARPAGNSIEPVGSDAGFQRVGDDDRPENRRAANSQRRAACGGTADEAHTASAACVSGAAGVLGQNAIRGDLYRARVAG